MKREPKKSHFYGDCILGKIILILYTRTMSTSHYLKMPLYMHNGCHPYKPNSHEDDISFNQQKYFKPKTMLL